MRDLVKKSMEGARVVRPIEGIVVHCTATKPSVNADVADIDRWHREEGFTRQEKSGKWCGYHFVVLRNGDVHLGRFIGEAGAHVAGKNEYTIGVCYVGGLDADGKSADTRTAAQRVSLKWLVEELLNVYPDAWVKGHRDFAAKDCPCFDAGKEYGRI